MNVLFWISISLIVWLVGVIVGFCIYIYGIGRCWWKESIDKNKRSDVYIAIWLWPVNVIFGPFEYLCDCAESAWKTKRPIQAIKNRLVNLGHKHRKAKHTRDIEALLNKRHNQ